MSHSSCRISSFLFSAQKDFEHGTTRSSTGGHSADLTALPTLSSERGVPFPMKPKPDKNGAYPNRMMHMAHNKRVRLP